MKELSVDDRPREKLRQHGVRALGDNELVALVLGSGSRHRDALATANELLAALGGVHGLARAGCDDLMRVGGIGAARGAQIIAALELGRRTLVRAPRTRAQLSSPRAAARVSDAHVRGAEHRTVRRGLARHKASSSENDGAGARLAEHRGRRAAGSVSRSDRRWRRGHRRLSHHPSGDPSPSPDDVELTERLVAAGVLMGVYVMDHIILGDMRYCSFKETGRF